LVKIGFDFLDLPENIEILGPSEQKLMVSDYEEYPVTVLFRPVRSIRGQILWPGGKVMSRSLIVILGKVTSNVDNNGYYWLKNLAPGEYDLKIKNLPKNYCLADNTQIHYVIPGEVLAITQNLTLAQACDAKK
jgi:hypothetical protein